MTALGRIGPTLVQARLAAGLSQRELAQRAGTVQSVVARIELGQGNPTLQTLDRLFAAAGQQLQLVARPLSGSDALVEAYKRDVDRTLIAENLKRSVDDRLRLNAEVIQFVGSARRKRG